MIELLIEVPLGTLIHHQLHPSCCYSPINGVIIRNKVCIVSPSINKVESHLSGRLRQCDEVITYDTIVFLSKVTTNLSYITNPNIKEVIFYNDGDINLDCEASSDITFSSKMHSNVYQFCLKNKLKHKKLFAYKCP